MNRFWQQYYPCYDRRGKGTQENGAGEKMTPGVRKIQKVIEHL
jgi:hypothetical protein